MKKVIGYFSVLLSILLLAGCGIGNTPTKKVENYLDNYRNLTDDVLTQLDKTIQADTIMTDAQKKEYRDILKKQYQNMTYTVKNEVIDGDKATVTVEIEVLDYYKITTETDKYYTANPDKFKDDNGNIVQTKYVDYRLEKLKAATDKVKYTIDFTLTKTDNKWVLDEIPETTRQKIHGLYAY